MNEGYVSLEAKRKCMIRTVVLGIIYLVMQFTIPIALMIYLLVIHLKDIHQTFEFADLTTAVQYESHILAEKTSFDDSKSKPVEIVEVTTNEIIPSLVTKEKPRLLSYNDDVWCFTKEITWHKTQQGWDVITNNITIDSLVHVRAIENGLEVISEKGNIATLWTYYGGLWSPRTPYVYDINKLTEESEQKKVILGQKTYSFKEEYNYIYFRESTTQVWEKVTHISNPLQWHAVAFKTNMYVISLFANANVVMKYNGVSWDRIYTKGLPDYTSLSYITTDTNGIYIISMFLPGSFSWYVFDGNNAHYISTLGKPMFSFNYFEMYFPYIILSFFSLLFAFLMSHVIRKYRVLTYSYNNSNVEYASVIRRGLAKMIDAIIVSLPLLIYVALHPEIFTQNMFTDLLNPLMYFARMMVLILLSMGSVLVFLFVFSLLEGIYCVTPGKWLLGIRVVGTDVQPCGFGRALLRNILRIIDCFFYYLVGILLIAFTKNHQRIGDLAARTIVIRDKRPSNTYDRRPKKI